MTGKTEYPIRIRFDVLESQELLDGVAEPNVIKDIVGRFARAEFLESDRDHITLVQTPIYARLEYEIKTLGTVLLTDEDDVDMLHTFFRLSTAWSHGPPWRAVEIAIGTSTYHRLREKLAIHTGIKTPDNEWLLAGMTP